VVSDKESVMINHTNDTELKKRQEISSVKEMQIFQTLADTVCKYKIAQYRIFIALLDKAPQAK
jgi:translation initiation factor IF-3